MIEWLLVWNIHEAEMATIRKTIKIFNRFRTLLKIFQIPTQSKHVYENDITRIVNTKVLGFYVLLFSTLNSGFVKF